MRVPRPNSLPRDPRRAVSAGAVLLLHVLVIAAFLRASFMQISAPLAIHEIEVSFPALVRRPIPLPERLRPQFVAPEMPRAVAPVLAPALPAAPAMAPPLAPGAISGVGRALFGCEPAYLDRLSRHDRALCLHLPKGTPRAASVLLAPPPDPNSSFTKAVEERHRKAVPILRACPQDSYNDIRGLPCFGFDQDSPLLPGR